MIFWTRCGIVAAMVVACAMEAPAALATDGSLYAWGENHNGQLGIGTSGSGSNEPIWIMDGVTATAAGGMSTLALKNGELWAWGDNYHGQLGDGTTIQRDSPVQIMLNGEPFTDITALATGSGSSYALTDASKLYAWGTNSRGQLGTGDTFARTTPTEVLNLPSNITAVAGGAYHCLALNTDGELWAWGNNSNGQLGDGTTDRQRNLPMPVMQSEEEPFANVTAISAGNYHSVALTSNGEVWSWGGNANGQLGIGTTGPGSNVPVQVQVMQSGNFVPFTGVTAIAASCNATLAVTTDGHVWGWGENFGETPIELFADKLTNIKDVAIGFRWHGTEGYYCYSYFALTATGTLYAWGDNEYGQLGLGTMWEDAAAVLEPQEVGEGFATIDAKGTVHVLAIKYVTTVPEPGSLVLLTLGAVSLLIRRRKRVTASCVAYRHVLDLPSGGPSKTKQ